MADGTILEMNRTYGDILHISNQSGVFRKNVFDILISDNAAQNFATVLQQADLKYFETQVCCTDDVVIWVLIRWQVVKDKDGGFKYYDCSMIDVTDRKNSEVALKSAHDNLEHIVDVRTQELVAANQELLATLDSLKKTQTQLVQTEKMASLGSLVAGIAHEINTPLGVSVTAASYLQQRTDEFIRFYADDKLDAQYLEDYVQDASEAVSIITPNLMRAAQLVKSFKQVSVDQSSAERRIFNIKQYLGEIVVSLRPNLKKTNIVLTVNCPDDLNWDGFPGAFAQIVTNLIMNSLAHAYEPDSVGTITIGIERYNENNLIFSYTDDGKGMDQDVLAKIFDPFFTTRRGVGSGLGLYILYNIVTQQFGGSVDCVSELGKGSKFTMCWALNAPLSVKEK
ncbi:PAS sensor protein (fragment) [Candidatus Desulfosporosinus infrequens]|uniref:histidine kinase n=1 Tax=Candidatus Desulfosporosinus infrequens TaxID=2043169 RepID=A0A2U3LU48_9FIRM